jgi:hypothetical protein
MSTRSPFGTQTLKRCAAHYRSNRAAVAVVAAAELSRYWTQSASHADCYQRNAHLTLCLCLQSPATCRHDTRPLLRTRGRLTAPQAYSLHQDQQLLPQSQALLAATVTAVSLLISSPAQAATAEANFGTKCVGVSPQPHVTYRHP